MGSRDTGKSTLISILTGEKDSDTKLMSEDSGTGLSFLEVQIVEQENTELYADESLFRETREFLVENTLTRVKAFVWCVTPSKTVTPELEAQARFLGHFCMWDSVILLVKNPWPRSAEENVQGALAAAAKCGARRENLVTKSLMVNLDSLENDLFNALNVTTKKRMFIKCKSQVRNECLDIVKDLGPARRLES